MLDIFFKVKSFYEKIERFNPVVFFFGGFTWDSFTLKRIDQLLDNITLLSYLLLFGCLLVITVLVDNDKITKPIILRYQKWFPLALQFFLGGLLSAYVIFFIQSASFTKTSLFVFILVVLLIANEFLEKRLKNVYLLLTLFFFVSFSFFIFFIPVVIKVMNIFTFIAGGLMSLLMVLGVVRFLYKKQVFASITRFRSASALVIGLYLLVNTFYYLNWIPPVPLSMKSAGIYHHASKSNNDDTFILRYEKPKWYQFFKNSDGPFHYADGDTVSCFTAVFAPTQLTKKIYHHWQMFSESQDKWLSTDKLGFEITGYRDGGYRGVTRKKNVQEGKWRVNIETEEGVLLGKIKFDIISVDKSVPLKTLFK